MSGDTVGSFRRNSVKLVMQRFWAAMHVSKLIWVTTQFKDMNDDKILCDLTNFLRNRISPESALITATFDEGSTKGNNIVGTASSSTHFDCSVIACEVICGKKEGRVITDPLFERLCTAGFAAKTKAGVGESGASKYDAVSFFFCADSTTAATSRTEVVLCCDFGVHSPNKRRNFSRATRKSISI